MMPDLSDPVCPSFQAQCIQCIDHGFQRDFCIIQSATVYNAIVFHQSVKSFLILRLLLACGECVGYSTVAIRYNDLYKKNVFAC